MGSTKKAKMLFSPKKKKKVADIQTDTRGGNCVQCFGVNENEQHK